MKPGLLLDDEVIIGESLKEWLTAHGYQIETVKMVKKPLPAISGEDSGIAILDLELSGEDGIDLIKRAMVRLKRIIIIAYLSTKTPLEGQIRKALGTVREEMKTGAINQDPVAEETVKEGKISFWDGKTPCWKMCHCPEAIQVECPALSYSWIPCWEIEGTFCKLDDDKATGRETLICEICPVYKSWGEGKPIKISLFGKGINTIFSPASR